MTLVIVIIVLLLLLIVGAPIGFAFALAGIVGAVLAGLPLSSIAGTPYPAAASFPLLAIPFFILAGELMNRGRLIDRLVDLAESIFFWLPGRIGHVTVVASAFLGAMTGSSVATVAAVSSSVGERMVSIGYKRGYVAALTASSGLLGVLIPPSIPLIVYGAAVGVSVSDLFLATIVPGILMTIVFMLVHALSASKVIDRSMVPVGGEGAGDGSMAAGASTGTQALRHLPRSLWSGLPALLMPVIILGGIYSGITTATEAAAIAGVYALAVILIGRMVRPGQVPKIFYKSALSAGAIMVIIAFTSIFNRVVTLMQVPQDLASVVTSVTENPLVFLLFVNLLLFLVGMFMETNAAVLLMAPLLFPAAMQMGIDPVHFGIILVTNIEIGLITPPMAANIYVSAKVNDASLPTMLPYMWRYLAAAIIVLLLITYFPAISLWWQ